MTKIPRIPVTSSQIHAIGYSPVTKELDIEFKSFAKKGAEPKPNSVYRYQNVGPETHAALMSAESIGRLFGAGIKPHADKYPFRKLTTEEAAQ